MNPQYEKELEGCVRRELDALGELPAPPALANRILRAIEQRATVPWYRQSWSMWPVALRTVSLTALVLAFGGLCFGAWEISQGATTSSWLTNWIADASTIWRTLGVLVNTTVSLISRLGVGVLAIGAALILGAWTTCIGLGTAYVRLAMRPAVN